MIYRIMKSIRAHPNAWILALGAVVAILPSAWRLAAIIAATEMQSRRLVTPLHDLSGQDRFSHWIFNVTGGAEPFVYILIGSWFLGPAIMGLAIVLMVCRRVFGRKMADGPVSQ